MTKNSNASEWTVFIFFCTKKAFAFKRKRRCKSQRKYFVERIVGASVFPLHHVLCSFTVISFQEEKCINSNDNTLKSLGKFWSFPFAHKTASLFASKQCFVVCFHCCNNILELIILEIPSSKHCIYSSMEGGTKNRRKE